MTANMALERYSRQMILPEVGMRGQQALCNARVLLIGAGGLGSPAAQYLAAVGIGHIRIVDPDVVELTNLHRQLLHGEADIGSAKVASAQSSMNALNSNVAVECVQESANAENLPNLLQQVDVVIDASDNFATRFLVNKAAYAACIPLVSGAAIRWQGQLALFQYDVYNKVCYECLYPASDETADNCSTAGIMPPVAGMIGCSQAMLAIQVILDNFTIKNSVNVESGVGLTLGMGGTVDNAHGVLHCFDALRFAWRRVNITADLECSVCGDKCVK